MTAQPQTARTSCTRPLIGIAAVLAGACISPLNTRVTTFGLADIRGGLGLGFDEGSGLTSVFAASQMLVAPAAAWLSLVFGARRFLLWAAAIFLLSSLPLPLAGDRYAVVLGLQILRELSVGTFIPAALGFIMRSLPPQWWIWGIAAYAFRFVFSQNISASLEAWYSENGHWQWIFRQNTPLTGLMVALIWLGMPRQGIDHSLLRRTDWGGIAFAGLGFALLYAALDQGNRLDWLNSGTVVGLAGAGALLIAAFLVNEGLVAWPLIRLPLLRQSEVWIPAILVALYGFGVTATAYILPDYLTRILGLRALQIGDVLNLIAIPQFLLVPLVALALWRTDARALLAFGFVLIALGSWIDTGPTSDWAGGDFLPSQIIEAIGLVIAITALITYTVANITPTDTAGIAVVVQTARLFGTEVGNAAVQALVRVREQIASNLLGQDLSAGTDSTDSAIAAFAAPFGAAPGDSTPESVLVISRVVQRESFVLAYIDAFWIVAGIVAAFLLFILLLPPPPPNNLTPPRLAAARLQPRKGTSS
jgi:DHA2 family multidrug resistance protein